MSRNDERRTLETPAQAEGAKLEILARQFVVPKEAVSSAPVIEKQFAATRSAVAAKPEAKKEGKPVRSSELPKGTRITREQYRKMQNEERGQDLAFTWADQLWWNMWGTILYLPNQFAKGLWLDLKHMAWPATKYLGRQTLKVPFLGDVLKLVGGTVYYGGVAWSAMPAVVRWGVATIVMALGIPIAPFLPGVSIPGVVMAGLMIGHARWVGPQEAWDTTMWGLDKTDEYVTWPIVRSRRGFKDQYN